MAAVLSEGLRRAGAAALAPCRCPVAVWAAAFVLSLVAPATGAEHCFTCHPAPGLAERIAGGRHTSPEAEARIFKGQAHADLACADCHPGASTVPHPEVLAPVACESCHPSVQPHIPKEEQEAEGLRGCVDCHGYHGVKPTADPDSPVNRANVPKLCATCHGAPDAIGEAYFGSVHGEAQTEDRGGIAAVCTDCHGYHPEQGAATLVTGVQRARLPETCGRCHEEILAEYQGSVHGDALKRGIEDVPVCSTCHGEHRIRPPDDPDSPVHTGGIPEMCGGCHAALPLVGKYGVDPEKYASYRHSYHGVANELGSRTVANCASCHGAHAIRDSSDPESSIHPSNLPATCERCHEGMNENVTRGQIHVVLTPSESPIVYWVAVGFRWLTTVTMLALIGHIILDFVKKLKLRREAARGGDSP